MRNVPGNTKLVKLDLENYYSNELYAKDESTNPSGSIKDRTVFGMLLKYKEDGTLVPGCTIVEATSGNTGISLAFYQKEFNYHCIIVMPKSASINRRRLIARYGGEILLVDGGMKECSEKVNSILKSLPHSFAFNQFSCLYNKLSHLATGREIENQLNDVDYIFAGFGTGGTISGIGSYFRNKREVKIIGIEPEESPLITKGFASSHKIEGIGANFIPANLDLNVIDKIVTVKQDDAFAYSKFLNSNGFNVGISAGAAYSAAINFIKQNDIKNKKILIIFPDKGDRYSW